MEKKAKHCNPSVETKRPAHRSILLARGLSFVLAVVLVPFLHTLHPVSEVYCSNTPPAKAAIVDHLSISRPSRAFVEQCTAVLQGAGYAVDYYDGNQVTVELYRSLPTCGYKIIVLRVHSAYIPDYLSLAFFTSEAYTKTRYVYEQLRNRVASGYLQPYEEGDPRYLVITDKFVRYSMQGSFDNALIIMMGCTGIKRCAASAFLEKGARAYIGWDGLVSANHTDRAIIQLLKYLLEQKQTIGEAVSKTTKNVGREARYKSTLLFWPIKAQSYRVEAFENSLGKGPGGSGEENRARTVE